MKIVLLTDGIPPYVMGGMQKHSRLIADYAAQSGIEVVLYHQLMVDENVSDEEVKATFSEAARQNITIRTFKYVDNGILPGHYLRAQKALSKKYLNRLLKEEEPDFVYTKGFMGWSLLEYREKHGFHCPIGVKFHGMNMYQAQPDLKSEFTKYLLRPPVKWIMDHADYVFSYGGEISSIIERVGIENQKIIEIPSGIERAAIIEEGHKRRAGVLKFAFVGRYDRLKGLPELYTALKRLDNSNWKLSIIGPVPHEHQEENERIQYIGKLSTQSEVFEVLDKCDALLCPSISEGMPNVILEAMARGLAIVASDVGATKLLVRNNGILVPPSNVKELIRSLNLMISCSDEDLTLMKNRSLEIVREEFTWEAVIESFINFLETTVRK